MDGAQQTNRQIDYHALELWVQDDEPRPGRLEGQN